MRSLRVILSLFLASMVLVSSTSFMVGIHRCGGEVRHLALFDKAAACTQEQTVPPCHRLDTPPCCQDSKVIHEQQDVSSAIVSWELPAAPLAESIVPALLLTEVVPVIAPAYPVTYDPPIRTSDRVVALHVFLI